MKNRIFRFSLVLVLVLSALGFSATAVLADTPLKYDWSITVPGYTDACSFRVSVVSNYTITEIDYFDQSGALTTVFQHFIGQDTFTANGKTLVGLPFTANDQMFFDSSGVMTRYNLQGVSEKIPLPDGTLFIAAGHTNGLNHSGEAYILSPDKGSQGDIAAFCAALAP